MQNTKMIGKMVFMSPFTRVLSTGTVPQRVQRGGEKLVRIRYGDDWFCTEFGLHGLELATCTATGMAP